MKDEIKEILESLDKISKAEYYPEDLLTYKECHLILDCITNLQEENKKLKEKIEHLLIDLDGESEYKIINEKAIEYIKKCRDYHKTYHKEEKIFPDEITSLLMILQGEDKDE